MSGVTEFLEKLGQRPEKSSAAAIAIEAGTFPTAQRNALLAGDLQLLAELIGARTQMTCMIVAPDSEPVREDEEPAQPDEIPDDSAVKAA